MLLFCLKPCQWFPISGSHLSQPSPQGCVIPLSPVPYASFASLVFLLLLLNKPGGPLPWALSPGYFLWIVLPSDIRYTHSSLCSFSVSSSLFYIKLYPSVFLSQLLCFRFSPRHLSLYNSYSLMIYLAFCLTFPTRG